MNEGVPTFLYKIVSIDNWDATKHTILELESNDTEFIHFSMDDQWRKIVAKRYANKSYVLLTIDTTKLDGIWKYEFDASMREKWWHLYNGTISDRSIVSMKIVDNYKIRYHVHKLDIRSRT